MISLATPIHSRRPHNGRCRAGIYLLVVVCYLLPMIFFFHRFGKDTFEDSARPGETFISDEVFLGCLRERLSHPADHPKRIPYVLMPVTMDYQDFKQFFCNVTVPMTYITIINNGEFKPIYALLDRATRELGAYVNRTLFITHHFNNIGYSSAVNEGLRHALTFSITAVPWVFISNADVRFNPALIEKFVHDVNEKTEGQEERIRLLDAEVAAEVVARTNVTDQRFTYRGSTYPVVTASSLPYRIRVMKPDEMKQQFSGVCGAFYTSPTVFMATFALSRLAIATVGFFDENYYPAYGEDHDYQWRMAALGFNVYVSAEGQFVHFERANLKVGGNVADYGIVKHGAYFIQRSKFGRMNYQPFRLHYRRLKWYPGHPELDAMTNRQPLPFNGTLPVDMWVLDKERRQSLWEIGENQRCRSGYRYYDMNLLNFSMMPS